MTGLGCVTPLGVGKDVFWGGLLAGESGVGPITLFDSSAFRVRIAGECTDFDPQDFLEAKKVLRLDPVVRFAAAGAQLAVADSGIDFSKEDPYRCGVIVGSGIGGLLELETQHTRLLARDPSRISPFMIPKLMINASAAEISMMYGLKGANTALATACASGTHSIGSALELMRADRADVMLTGGSEAAVTPLGIGGFCAMHAMSRRGGDPRTCSRPFDRGRDGFVMGEGAGIVVLEELEHARARGAKVYCEVVGLGMSADASHITEPDVTGEAAAVAMREAMRLGRVDLEEVGYINAHGTATPKGDVAETNAIKTVFGTHARKIAISSTKSMIGHLLGASGGVEMVATCLSVAQGRVHPTINQFERDPECDLDYVPNEARELEVRAALSNSFGFGGHNATVAVRKFDG